jgi:hypothetical protein
MNTYEYRYCQRAAIRIDTPDDAKKALASATLASRSSQAIRSSSGQTKIDVANEAKIRKERVYHCLSKVGAFRDSKVNTKATKITAGSPSARAANYF